MNKISFSIIGHNEGYLLEDCFNSIKDIAFEIVYVDCGSKDNSLEIAERFGAKIFRKENDFNINVSKQYGIEKCAGKWIFYIDPDERLTDNLRKEIVSIVENTEYDAFNIPRKNYYFGKWLKYGGKYPDYQLRLFRKGKARFECKKIHEKLKVDGKIDYLKSPFEHIVVENTDRLLDKIKSYSYRVSYENIRLNKNYKGLIIKGIRRFISNYIFKLGFLDGKIGLFVHLIDLFNAFIFYFKTEELKKNENN